MIEQALASHLVDDAQLSALVSGRVYYVAAPQEVARPYVVYQRVTAQRMQALDGPCGVARVRIQVTAWADDPAAARDVANAVRESLDGLTGADGIGAARIDSEVEDYNPETARFGRALDVIILHQE